MAEQRLHSALAPIDVLTRLELEEVTHKELSNAVRARYIGVDSVRFPDLVVTATAANVFLGTGGTMDPPIGPAEGDVWMVRRIIVKSSVLGDTAKYVLYRGSTPSDILNAYGPRNVLDAFSSAIAVGTPSQPAVPATGVAQQNVNQFPVQVVISPNGATITNVSVNGVTVGTAAGTYTVPANGSISIAYTVATPTWVWSNLNAAVPAGLGVNIGFYPGTKAIMVQPGEQIYAQVFGGTVGNQYYLDGEAIRVPAEMKGKVLT
jgi:hypothetical protein